MRHTPGPWKYPKNHLFADVGDGLKIRDAVGNQIVAVVRGPVALQRSLEEWEANAELVACAPELLACVKLFVKALQDPKPDQERIALLSAFQVANRLLAELNEEEE